MVVAAGLPHQAALPPALLPAFEASCTRTSRTTNVTKHAPGSPRRPSSSCAPRFPGGGPKFVTRSPTTFVLFHQRIFGYSGEQSIGKEPAWRNVGVRGLDDVSRSRSRHHMRRV